MKFKQFSNITKRLYTKNMSEKVNYPSAERNKIYILDVLKKHFDSTRPGEVLEIASGTGQHSSYFAKHFPHLTFYPSEIETALFNSIKAYAQDTPHRNLKNPVEIDITDDSENWKLELKKFDYMININMIHISPFDCTNGLFVNASKLLKPNGLLAMYGPFAENGVIKPQSNVDFDESLRSRDPSWGLRDIKDLEEIAGKNGIKLIDKCDLPSNNKCLIWKRLS